jgi:hypothetical protein
MEYFAGRSRRYKPEEEQSRRSYLITNHPTTTLPYTAAREERLCSEHPDYHEAGDHGTRGNRKRWRRKRTVFSPSEMAVLEGVYEKHKFLNPTLKANILSRVSVTSNVVVMWFQNRRAKDRAAGIAI